MIRAHVLWALMFIVGGAALGVVLLHEPMTWQKALGLAASVVGIYLVSS